MRHFALVYSPGLSPNFTLSMIRFSAIHLRRQRLAGKAAGGRVKRDKITSLRSQ
ncbi:MULTISPECIES: hypothetical protein [Nostoc]|uniref:Uncharacterized protein n=2 Tax=Nostoc TaxID=1177 RepID=A0ABR8IDT2_9NOSO|nr:MULTISPECIES: hypothetical protein [Nostoc]MBD2565536.1 hypothetical protein [Nostoc linckia FACHB-391]MBD2649567.1 hypothetical protein [Nostoc foliaceum FACHB-393]